MASLPRFSLALLLVHAYFLFFCHASTQSAESGAGVMMNNSDSSSGSVNNSNSSSGLVDNSNSSGLVNNSDSSADSVDNSDSSGPVDNSDSSADSVDNSDSSGPVDNSDSSADSVDNSDSSGPVDNSDSSADSVDNSDPSSATTEEFTPVPMASCQNLTEMMLENGKDFSEYCDQENQQSFFASPNSSRVFELALNITVVGRIIKTGLNNDQCGDLIQDMLCRYVFPLCDNESLPEAPCYQFCTNVLRRCGSEWNTLWTLMHEIDSIVNSSVYNPFSFLLLVLPTDCSHLSYYNDVTYSNSCNCMGMETCTVNTTEESSSLGLEIYLPIAAVSGLLLVVIAIIVLLCCWKRWRRRKKMRRLGVYPYSSSYDNWNRTLPGWPFVHPRNSRFKGKRELYRQVPESYMEILADHMDYLIQFSRIHTTTYLAEGGYSEVYQGYVVDLQPHQTQTYRNVVIKRFKEHVRELDVMDYLEMCLKISDVNHPNVMRLIGMGFNLAGSISLVYPYMVEHDLLTFLKKKRSNDFSSKPSNEMDIGKLVDIVMQIGLGMRAITEMGITYKMLSAHTCMCDSGPHVVIGDASMCQQLGVRGVCLEEVYDRWVAPEGVRGKQFSEKSDVWSYGVTCWEVFSLGRHPYEEVGNSELLAHIAHGNRLERPPLCPPSVFSIMKRCWYHEPKHRPSFSELAGSLSDIMGSNNYQREVERIEEMLREEENCSPDRLADGVFERHQQTASHALVSATLSAPLLGAARKNDVSHQWSAPGATVIPGVALTVISERDEKREQHSRSASPARITETAFHGDREIPVRWSQFDRLSQSSGLEESLYAELSYQGTNSTSCEKPFTSSEIKESREVEGSGEYANSGLVPSTRQCSLELPPVKDDHYYNLPQSYLSAMPKSSSVLRTAAPKSQKETPSPPPVFKKPKVLPRLSKNKNDNSHAPNSGLGI